ncbi:MAG: 3-oxoacyl-ACP reductase FabG [Deltaproteobacteria bacterium]|nr:3-oxoacyl-ACP reductase FabG [Deltaproteobacteria bacterium]
MSRVALVAGGSGEIGAAIVRKLCAQCSTVYAGFVSRQPAAASDAVRSVLLDLRDGQQVDQVCEQIHADHGRLDIVVNAAAVNVEAPALAMTDEDWQRVIDTNLTGAFRLSRAAGKYMMLGRWGRLIHISSISATMGGRGQINYASSKAALESMTRVLAIELGRRGVLVNCVAPGVIETEMSARVREEHGDKLLEAISVRRFGKPEEVAEVVAFLASEAAGYINGQVIRVDGGLGL